MLEDEAKHPFAYTRGAALHRLNGIGAFHPENVPTPPTNGGASSTGSALNTGSGQSPVSASDLQKLITCFTNSKWSMEWCGVVCCLTQPVPRPSKPFFGVELLRLWRLVSLLE